MEKKWWEEGNDSAASDGAVDSKRTDGDTMRERIGEAHEAAIERAHASVREDDAASSSRGYSPGALRGVRWPVVLRWWGVSTAVAAVVIAGILIHAHLQRAEETVVPARATAAPVQSIAKTLAQTAVRTAAVAPVTANGAIADIAQIGAAPTDASVPSCTSHLGGMKAALEIAWPSPEHVDVVQGWRQFARQCRDTAVKASDGQALVRAIDAISVKRVEAEVTDPPNVANRASCVASAATIRLVQSDRLPVGNEVAKVVAWRGFIDGCRRAAPELWSSGTGRASAAAWPPSSVSGESCVAAIGGINAVAHELDVSPVDLPRLKAWHDFTDECLHLNPTPFEGGPGTFAARRDPPLPPAPAIEEATEATCAARLPIFNQVRLTGSTVEGIAAWNAFQAACQKLWETRSGPNVTSAPSPATQSVSAVAVRPNGSGAAVETLPPVPPSATSQTCALGLATLNRVHAATGGLGERGQAWAAFGYSCLATVPPALVADASGYSLPARVPTKATAEPVKKIDEGMTGKGARVANSSVSQLDRVAASGSDLNGRGARVANSSVSQLDPVAASGSELNGRGARVANSSVSQLNPVAASASERKCVLKGAVVSQDGSPLAGAKVVLTGQGIAVNASLSTDANGGWATEPLPDGSVQVVVSADKHFGARSTASTCQVGAVQPVRLETCNALTCAARRLDEKLHLGGH